jgi:hypothetical protein
MSLNKSDSRGENVLIIILVQALKILNTTVQLKTAKTW